MPKLHVTAAEAASLKKKRARNKAWNTAIDAAADTVKKRLKASQDPLQTATLLDVQTDLRKLLR